MEINYRTQVAAQAEQHAAEQKAAANDAAWQEIINCYPIRDHQGNRNQVEFYSPNGTFTLETFKFLIANAPQGFTLEWSNEKTLKTELINEIFERSSRNGAVPEHSKSSMAGWSLRQLRNRLDEVIRREVFSQFPPDALKAGIAEQRKKEDASKWYFDRVGRKWPRLRSITVPPGHADTRSTSEFLRQTNPIMLQHYLSRFGQEQVDFYLNQ